MGRRVVAALVTLIGVLATLSPPAGAQTAAQACQVGPVRFYIDVEGPPELVAFRFVHVSTCGAWLETESRDVGDIAC